ncbi:unnamed protein product [Aspergillus oryzae RIB40]|uniref:DNA, SC001 n=1 Tax=Aspergillus oryzae (strain ATCC 42149 / RIB 40) TaxID=510516 RepID=Q2UNM7_ASPOR|nr:unnamed protein product [Aspergillus oryzae RIB40]BAE56838.1 unnamed protein product [Aspergillus oryzae RIB40]
MSLFGNQTQTQQSGGLFGSSTTANKPSPFGGAATGGSLFGSNTTGTGTQQSSGGLFGQTQNQGATGAAPASGGLFGSSTATSQPQQSGGLFGNTTTQNQPQTGGLFGNTATQQKPAGGLFGGLGQSTQQQQPQQQQTGGGLFGGALGQQKPQGSLFGASIGPVGATAGVEPLVAWSRRHWRCIALTLVVHRTVPTQIAIVKDKWDTASRNSPFRAYLYNHVGEEAAPFYQPGPDDDESKWEEALRKRPAPGYVPVIVRGFFELGKRAQRQKDFLTMMQTRLHEINNCLTELLSRHDLKISVRIADCRRKHLVLSKRCLALAAKTQVLRNRGYAMDDAEEELKKKLALLERSVFDPSLNGREEEIWARMLAIREHSKRLQLEMEKAGPGAAAQADDELDEQTMKTAKKILDDYHTQIKHLQKELESVRKDFDEAEKLQGRVDH